MKHKDFVEWDSLTAKFAGVANLPFLLLQLPQIILNYRNLVAGNRSALLAVPWLVRDFYAFLLFSSFDWLREILISVVIISIV